MEVTDDRHIVLTVGLGWWYIRTLYRTIMRVMRFCAKNFLVGGPLNNARVS